MPRSLLLPRRSLLLLLLLLASSCDALKPSSSVMKRFDAMLEACTLSPSAINCIDSPQQRKLFKGVAAANSNSDVRSAFAVVYNDLGPVRVAGDLIFNQLKKTATAAADECRVLPLEDEEALNAARAAFDAMDTDQSHVLDKEELLASTSLLAPLRTTDDFDAADDEALVDAILREADADGDGQISFVEWAKWLQLGEEGTPLRLAALNEVRAQREQRKQAAAREEEVAGSTAQRKSRRQQLSHGEKFDEMLNTCMGWEEHILGQELGTSAADDEDRLSVVLHGTFAGGHDPAVVDALRVCYEDYRALRIGGDLIFRVLKTVVARRGVPNSP